MTKVFREIVEFVHKLYGTDFYIPLHEPKFLGNEKRYLEECIDSTFVSSVGKFVTQFEEVTAAYCGARRAVVCANGTAALHLSLVLSEVKPNDEVITQPMTFIATANAICYTGASPLFIDVDLDTMGLSPSKMNDYLESNAFISADGFTYNKLTGKRISACVPMHTFGHPVKIEDIVQICSKWNISLIEDAAESIGSRYKGKHTGTFGKFGVLSFNGNKTITTGGGGMILTNDESLGASAKHYTTQAKIPHPWEYKHDAIGYNYRMPNINAALGVAQMEKIDILITKKRELAEIYKHFFANIGVVFVTEPENSLSNYWLNTLIFKNIAERNEFLSYSNANNVMSRPAWTLMNKLEMFKTCVAGNLDNASWLSARLVNIPSTPII
jgi:perosamine synthetase